MTMTMVGLQLDPTTVDGLERLVLRAPRLVERAPWRLRQSGNRLDLVLPDCEPNLDQPSTLSYGMAVEFLLVGLHQLGSTATVTFLPDDGSGALASLDLRASARASKVDVAMYVHAASRHWPAFLELPRLGGTVPPYQRDLLVMAAAADRTRIVWDLPVSPGSRRAAIVSRGDMPPDWFHAGRAAAHLLLRGRALGITCRFVTPSLRERSTRTTLGAALRPTGVPQLLLQAEPSATPPKQRGDRP